MLNKNILISIIALVILIIIIILIVVLTNNGKKYNSVEEVKEVKVEVEVEEEEEPVNWDADRKSDAINITGGTIDRKTATTQDYIHSTKYQQSQNIDFEFKINSITGPNLFVSLCDINTQGRVTVGTFENACSEFCSVVLSTTGDDLMIRYKTLNGVIRTIIYQQKRILSKDDVVKFSLRDGIVKLFLNDDPLNADFNGLAFRLTRNYYIRFSDAAENSSSFNITSSSLI